MTVDFELLEKIFTLSRFMKDNMSYASGLMRLSLLQVQVLVFLHKKHNAQMRDVAEHFTIEMPTATNLIGKLVRQHLVIRKADPKDRRLVRLMLTKEGNRLLQDAMKQRNQKISKLLSYLPDKDKKHLLAILSLLIAKMEVAHEK